MASLYDRLEQRRFRAAFQLLAAGAVIAAIGLAVVDRTVTRGLSAVLIGGVALATLKLSLLAVHSVRLGISGSASRPASEVPPTAELLELQTNYADLLAAHEQLRADVAGQRSDVETAGALARRAEPSIAELAILRHEVTYLRETIDHLHRTNGLS